MHSSEDEEEDYTCECRVTPQQGCSSPEERQEEIEDFLRYYSKPRRATVCEPSELQRERLSMMASGPNRRTSPPCLGATTTCSSSYPPASPRQPLRKSGQSQVSSGVRVAEITDEADISRALRNAPRPKQRSKRTVPPSSGPELHFCPSAQTHLRARRQSKLSTASYILPPLCEGATMPVVQEFLEEVYKK